MEITFWLDETLRQAIKDDLEVDGALSYDTREFLKKITEANEAGQTELMYSSGIGISSPSTVNSPDPPDCPKTGEEE